MKNVSINETKYSAINDDNNENSLFRENSNVSWFRISRLHFLPFNEIKVSEELSNVEKIIDIRGKLDFCENHFSNIIVENMENHENIIESNIHESQKLLSSSVSSLTKFEYLNENTSSFASDNCNVDKYFCDDTQRIINTEKQRKRRRIIFCCLG